MMRMEFDYLLYSEAQPDIIRHFGIITQIFFVGLHHLHQGFIAMADLGVSRYLFLQFGQGVVAGDIIADDQVGKDGQLSNLAIENILGFNNLYI